MKGRFTIRTAGVFFWLSAILEILSIRIEVPILGALRGGLVGGAYHVAFAVIFTAVGFGLWMGARWAPRAVYLATLVYTLDRFRYALDWAGREAELRRQVAGHPEIIEAFGVGPLLTWGALLALVFVACWWGFAVYIYVRRVYFAGGRGPGDRRPGSGGLGSEGTGA